MSNNETAIMKAPSIVRDSKAFWNMLQGVKGEFHKIMSPEMTERMFKVGLMALSTKPELLQCTNESSILALMECGILNLEPTGPLGEAYLIPRKSGMLSEKYGKRIVEMHFQPGYRGLMKLARNSGEISWMESVNVYEGDFFDYERGLEPFLKHKPTLVFDDRGKIVHTYSIARFRDPTILPSFFVMTIEEVEAIRQDSVSKNSDAWTNPVSYPEMVRKTPVIRHTKYLPADTKWAAVVVKDSSIEGPGEALQLSQISPEFGEAPEVGLAPVVSGVELAHDAMNGVQQAEVVEEKEEAPQETAEAPDSPPASAKDKDIVWLNWCESATKAGSDDPLWNEKQLVKYAEEQGIKYSEITHEQAEELVLFMAEDTKAVEKWITDAIG